MTVELTLLALVPIAFACEFVDTSIGMGYGTMLAPILLLMGYEPATVVPAILVSECFTGILGAYSHHSFKNANFSRHSLDTRVALVLIIFTVGGTVAAVWIASLLPQEIVKIWISAIVIGMGVFLLLTWRSKPRFSWLKVCGLGALASFNKGASGGGFGPLVMGGQMLSGIGVKNAIGITSLAEGVTCIVGVVMYYLFWKNAVWALAPWITVGAVCAVPLAAKTLHRLPEKAAKIIAAVVILCLGATALVKALA